MTDQAAVEITDSGAEVTAEMIEAGAKALDDQLWKLDPFTKQMPLAALKLIIPKVYRAMAAAAVRT